LGASILRSENRNVLRRIASREEGAEMEGARNTIMCVLDVRLDNNEV
jgi:hypothetical protein